MIIIDNNISVADIYFKTSCAWIRVITVGTLLTNIFLRLVLNEHPLILTFSFQMTCPTIVRFTISRTLVPSTTYITSLNAALSSSAHPTVSAASHRSNGPLLLSNIRRHLTQLAHYLRISARMHRLNSSMPNNSIHVISQAHQLTPLNLNFLLQNGIDADNSYLFVPELLILRYDTLQLLS